jgi:hypothetical protein
LEHVRHLCAQSSSSAATVHRLAFIGCTLDVLASGSLFDSSIPSGFFDEMTFCGCPFINGPGDFDGFTNMNVVGNTFLAPITFNGGSGTVCGNSFVDTLTFTGAFSGLAAVGNVLTGGSALTNSATGFIRVFGTVSNNLSNDNVVDQLKNISAASLGLDGRLSLQHQDVPYSASMTPDASKGNIFVIVPTNGTAFTINAPTNPKNDQEITVRIANGTGGALGAVTWNSVFKLAAWTQPANGFSRSARFYFNSVSWIQISSQTPDIPN